MPVHVRVVQRLVNQLLVVVADRSELSRILRAVRMRVSTPCASRRNDGAGGQHENPDARDGGSHWWMVSPRSLRVAQKQRRGPFEPRRVMNQTVRTGPG